MRSTQETDSGSYVNGIYMTKNGTSNGGLGCPKGQRAFDPEMKPAVYFMPPDRGETEDFVPLTQDVAPDVMPYYAISNYGRVINIYTGNLIKPCQRPNGYEYLCLAAEGTKSNGKPNQKKYSIHRSVMKTFCPVENMDNLEVNHINYNKSDNYVNKTMPDGSVESNLEWNTPSENTRHRSSGDDYAIGKLKASDIKQIRHMRSDLGCTYTQINKEFPQISVATIQLVCQNKVYYNPNYNPKDYTEIAKIRVDEHALTDEDVEKIRRLSELGMTYKEIQEKFYPNYHPSTISVAARGITHNQEN